MIIQHLQQFSKHLLHAENSVQKLALSTSLGIYVAFSPFIGLHTLMAICLAWLFSFNVIITLSVSCLINNPWTMVPVYGCDYLFGKWFCYVCNIDFMRNVPTFFNFVCEPISYYVGLPTYSLWTFFLGGNVLSLLLALLMYHPVKWAFQHFKEL